MRFSSLKKFKLYEHVFLSSLQIMHLFFFNLTEESAAFNQEWQHKAREAQLLQHSLEYPQRRHSGRGQEPQLALPE